MSETPVTATPSSFAAGGAALVEFARALTAASDLEELELSFAPRAGRLLSAPMYGFYALDEEGSRIEHNVAVNVSDFFVARYVQVMDDDLLLTRSREIQRPVYNLGLMSEPEWEESAVYRHAYSVHRMRHVVEMPIVDDGRIVGALHFAASEPDRNVTEADLRVAEAIAGVLALSIGRIRRRRETERALDEALAALEITGVALVTSSTRTPDLRLNEPARRLLSAIVDDDEHLSRLLARAPGDDRFSRRAEVALRTGESGVLQAHSRLVDGGSVVTVLELQRQHAGLDQRLLGLLTPRQSEIATLLAEGLGDREIAETLYLSRFTVQQHVKRIYRILGVDSRVALTRLLLGAPIVGRRSSPYP
jgi:DNA-binding NarL/FixJ family response regulator